jgi:hypothetical protein
MTQPEYIPSENWTERNTSFILKIAVFVILLVIVLLSTGYMKKIFIMINPDLENCHGGKCREACIKGEELQKQGVQCSDTAKICCIPNLREPSPECAGRSKGEPCGKMMICDEFRVCMTRCEYCSMNPDDDICIITEKVVGNPVVGFNEKFTCGCTDMDCISLENSKLGTCISGYCPSENPLATDYMCCINPYKGSDDVE